MQNVTVETGSSDRRKAIVLLGPTGSGKTPLGELIEERGLGGHRCRHFDFGANLREIAAYTTPDELFGRQEIALFRQVLEEGVLLEDAQFPLAARVLRRFLTAKAADPETWIVLNGLPRHLGQAETLQPIVDVQGVIYLACSPEAVAGRIHNNVGGDRTQRKDDSPEAIARKLEIFAQRTSPLLAYYSAWGGKMQTIRVAADMTAEEMWSGLAF